MAAAARGGGCWDRPGRCGASDSDGATSPSQAGVGHSGAWGKCLVETIGDVVHTCEAVLPFSCTRRVFGYK